MRLMARWASCCQGRAAALERFAAIAAHLRREEISLGLAAGNGSGSGLRVCIGLGGLVGAGFRGVMISFFALSRHVLYLPERAAIE